MNKTMVTTAIALITLSLGWTCNGQDLDGLEAAITQGTPSLELRLSYEHSSTDDANAPARGLNLRTRLGYRTADYHGTNVFLQFHNLTNLIEDFQFSKVPGGDINRDVILDPDGDRVHQAYLEVTALPDTKLRIGR